MNVIVVGAGPAGAATALLLARYGIPTLLIERERSFARVFRGEGLMPSGIDALHEIGLGAALAAVPSRVLESWNIWIDGQEVFVIPEPVAELGARAMRVVAQPALLDRFVADAQRSPTFTFETGVRVTELVREDGRIVGVRTSRAEGVRDLRADLVIGCDGRGSSIRTNAGLHLTLLPEQYDVLWFKLPAPPQLAAGCRMFIMVAGGAHPAICYTSWDGRLQYGLVLPKGAVGALGDRDWLQEAARPAPAWLAAHLLAERNAIEGPLRLNVLVGRCAQWSAPGLLLLGDAAHPMSPVRAQGINMAFRDAIVAANHLVPALRSGERVAVDAAAQAVQAEREVEIVRSQTLQLREARGQGDARSTSWRFAVARRVAPVLGRYRWAQRAWLARQHELRFGVTDVRLRVPP